MTFYPLSAAFDEGWPSVYLDMPPDIEFITGYGPPLLEPFLRNRRGYYDTIFVSRPHNMKLLQPILAAYPEWFEETIVVYDAEALFVAREITLRQLTGTPLPAEEAEEMLKEEVDAEDIAEIVSKWTGIPVSKMLEGEREKLLTMEDNLHERVIGQDEAVS